MTDDPVDRLEASLSDLGGTLECTTPDAATATIEAAIDSPAVGVPLSIHGVSLPDAVTSPPTPESLSTARTGVTGARFAIASLGSLAIESTAAGDEPVSLFGERHVAVIAADRIVPDLAAAFDRLEAAFADGDTSVVLATGRSSTADMGALIHGVHGPSAIHVIVVEGGADD